MALGVIMKKINSHQIWRTWLISNQLNLASTHSILLFPGQTNGQNAQKCNETFNTKGKPKFFLWIFFAHFPLNILMFHKCGVEYVQSVMSIE